MLGIFRGKNREKANNSVATKDKDEEKQRKRNEIQEKGKEEKFSRFSFKRRRSSEKKKKNKVENAELSSSSSTSSIVSYPSLPSGGNEKAAAGEKPEESDVGDPISETSSASEESLNIPGRMTIDNARESPSLASNRTASSIYSSELDDSFSTSDSSSLRSESYLQNGKFFRNAVSTEQNTSTKIETPNSLNIHSKSIRNPLLTTRNHCNIASSNESIKTLTRSPSNDGTLSMLSTPSSSTSSLSSISNRPTSPSGRGTPPGPKLGTAVRIPSSPTPLRKTSRTHIKTNPAISSTSRRVGAVPLFGHLTVNLPLVEKPTDSPVSPEFSNGQSSCFLSKSPIISRSSESKTFTFQDNNTLSPPQSPSSNSARLRLSVSSMQSLESIPEIDSDATMASKDILRRTKLNIKLPNALLGVSVVQNINAKDGSLPIVPECISLQNGANHSRNSPGRVIKTSQEIHGKKAPPVKQSESKESKCYSNASKVIVSTKPPSISKRPKDPEILNLDNSSKESQRPNLSLNTTNSSSPLLKTNPKEIIANDNAFRAGQSATGNITTGKLSTGEATHVIFKIPINNPKKKTSSLENLPTNKLLFKDDIFPRSGSPRCPLIRVRRSKSLTRVDAIQNGTYFKFTIPITKDKLKQQAAKFAKSLEEKKEDEDKIKKDSNTIIKKNLNNKKDCAKSNKQVGIKQICTSKPVQSPNSAPCNAQNNSAKTVPSSIGHNLARLNETISDLPQNPKFPRITKTTQNINLKATKQSTRGDVDSNLNQNNNAHEEIHKKGKNFTIAKAPTDPGIPIESLGETRAEPLPGTDTKKLPRGLGLQESPPDSPSVTLNSNELSETDSVTQDTNDSQNIVRELITIQIEDSPNFISRKIDLDSSFEKLQKSLQDKLIQTEDYNEDDTISKKELVAQEERYQRQVDDLSKKLAEKQQETKDLSEALKEAKKATLKKDLSEQQRYEIQIDQLKTKIREEETKTESVRVELQYARNEIEFSQAKMRRLEEDLTKANELAESLHEQNANRSRDAIRLKELEDQVKSLEDKLRKSECSRKDLETSLAEIETERDEEMKIVQDALDEAAEERQELITSFKKELELLNTTNTAREQQMLEDFEWKLHEMEKEYKSKLEDNNRQAENSLQRVKRHTDEEEVRQKLEKQRNEINAEWEDKLRKECSRLKAELDDLHSEEKHLAVESMKVQKEQDNQRLRKSWEQKHDEMATQVSSLKDSLVDKDAYYHRELDNQRTMTDRDLWDLRMKLQKLNESSYDQKQQLEEKYREDMERLRIDFEERIKELETRLAICDAQKGVDLIGQMEKEHKTQMQHVGEQHQLSMERLREELEAEKFQAVEDTRLIITNHHVDIENNVKEQLAQAQTNESQIRDELEAIRSSLQCREESLRNLEEQFERYKELKNDSSYSITASSLPPATSTTSSGFSSSQFSLASNDSQDSRNSQDRYSYRDSISLAEGQDDSQRNTGLLGKVFGGGWFTPTKAYSRRGSTPLSYKKPYS